MRYNLLTRAWSRSRSNFDRLKAESRSKLDRKNFSLSKFHRFKSAPSKSSRSEPVRSDSVRSEAVRPVPARAEPDLPDPNRPHPDCAELAPPKSARLESQHAQDTDVNAAKGSPTSVDPDEERSPPPQPTLVYFPQNEVKLTSTDDWVNQPPDLAHLFATFGKPTDLKAHHLLALNLAADNDVPLEDLVPAGSNSVPHLPPESWLQSLNPASRRVSVQAPPLSPEQKHLILGNGAKAPGPDIFVRNAKEIACSTEDGLRETARKKPKPGHRAPHISHYRDFWDRLELMAQYWDTSLDNYYEAEEPDTSSKQTPPASPRSIKRWSAIFMGGEKLNGSIQAKADSAEKKKRKRYKGWRKSNGSKMPEALRIECVKVFVRNIAYSFSCHMAIPRRTPHIEFKSLLLPVNQSVCFWGNPEDKDQLRRGIGEGPVLSVQCRGDTNFARDSKYCALDVAREISGLLLLAQERNREGKKRSIPGADKWYTTKPRWGGGPGGEFGEGEAKKEGPPRRTYTPTTVGFRPKTEEQIWKELNPGEGLWEPRTNYRAIGKDRRQPFDTVRNA